MAAVLLILLGFLVHFLAGVGLAVAILRHFIRQDRQMIERLINTLRGK